MKKRPLTLMEVMVALALAGILLSSLFHFLYQTFSSNLKLQKVKEQVLAKQCMHQRLILLFSKAAAKRSSGQKATLYTTPEGLFLKTSGEIDPDPEFCGELSHLLYIDPQEHSLCLVTWSKNQKFRHQVLLIGVNKLELQFFKQEGKSLPSWHSLWSQQETNLPQMIRLKLPEYNLECAYFL